MSFRAEAATSWGLVGLFMRKVTSWGRDGRRTVTKKQRNGKTTALPWDAPPPRPVHRFNERNHTSSDQSAQAW
jgi:hypothetical protein